MKLHETQAFFYKLDRIHLTSLNPLYTIGKQLVETILTHTDMNSHLFISHDLAVVRHMADNLGVMYLGRLCEVAPVDDIFDNPLHPYTQLLLETIPDVEMTGRKRAPVAGEIPNPIDPPSGCPFHPRCPLMAAYCRKVRPELETLESGVKVACYAVLAGSTWRQDSEIRS